MNRKFALTLTLLAAALIFIQPARADMVNFDLSSPLFVGLPGQTVDFFGTISAPGTNTGSIDLLGLNVTFGDNLGGPWLAFNDINVLPFYSLPEYLYPGDSLTNALLFTATIDPAAVPASGAVKVDLVAFDAAGNNVSTTAIARAAVPEPATLWMIGAAVIGLGMIRRKGSTH